MTAIRVDESPDTSVAMRNIILLHLRGWSVRAIAEDIDIPKSTVQDMIERWRKAPRIVHLSRQSDRMSRHGV